MSNLHYNMDPYNTQHPTNEFHKSQLNNSYTGYYNTQSNTGYTKLSYNEYDTTQQNTNQYVFHPQSIQQNYYKPINQLHYTNPTTDQILNPISNTKCSSKVKLNLKSKYHNNYSNNQGSILMKVVSGYIFTEDEHKNKYLILLKNKSAQWMSFGGFRRYNETNYGCLLRLINDRMGFSDNYIIPKIKKSSEHSDVGIYGYYFNTFRNKKTDVRIYVGYMNYDDLMYLSSYEFKSNKKIKTTKLIKFENIHKYRLLNYTHVQLQWLKKRCRGLQNICIK